MNKQNRTHIVALTGVLAALAVALSFIESLLPPLPVPGAKVGLANVTLMIALLELPFPCAAGVAAVKVLFALFRGGVSCLMSLAGTTLSLVGMMLVKRTLSPVGMGVFGAFLHNAGQWVIAYLLYGDAMLYYAPLLCLLAIPAGILTGLCVLLTAPYRERHFR